MYNVRSILSISLLLPIVVAGCKDYYDESSLGYEPTIRVAMTFDDGTHATKTGVIA